MAHTLRLTSTAQRLLIRSLHVECSFRTLKRANVPIQWNPNCKIHVLEGWLIDLPELGDCTMRNSVQDCGVVPGAENAVSHGVV